MATLQSITTLEQKPVDDLDIILADAGPDFNNTAADFDQAALEAIDKENEVFVIAKRYSVEDMMGSNTLTEAVAQSSENNAKHRTKPFGSGIARLFSNNRKLEREVIENSLLLQAMRVCEDAGYDISNCGLGGLPNMQEKEVRPLTEQERGALAYASTQTTHPASQTTKKTLSEEEVTRIKEKIAAEEAVRRDSLVFQYIDSNTVSLFDSSSGISEEQQALLDEISDFNVGTRNVLEYRTGSTNSADASWEDGKQKETMHIHSK